MACVMGHRVAYSRSPMIHNHWLRSLGLRGGYELMDIAPEAFPEFFRNLADRGYVGGNVTTPHKDAAFRLVDHREGPAEASATIVQRVLAELGVTADVLLWNVVPTHPGGERLSRPQHYPASWTNRLTLRQPAQRHAH